MKFDIRRVRDIKTKEIPSEMEQWVPDTGPQLRHLIWSNVDVRSGTYEEKDGSIRKLTWKEISKINVVIYSLHQIIEVIGFDRQSLEDFFREIT